MLVVQVYFSIRSYDSTTILYPNPDLFVRYYKVKGSTVIIITISWIGILSVGWNDDFKSNLILISVVIFMSELLDLYFAYVIYSAGVFISKVNLDQLSTSPASTNRNITSRVQTITYFSRINQVYPHEGIRTESDELFQRHVGEIEIAVPMSTQENENPPRLEIKVEDLTVN